MRIVGYSETYQNGMLACLKRNYRWMEKKTDDELLRWLQPILSYSWEKDFPQEQFPYKYGMVLLNDIDEVVGYLGLIYSKQFIDSEWKTIVNPTTWAIDEAYRSETFKCIYFVQQTADIVVDFTARRSLVEIFTKMFCYDNMEQTGCFFLPKPYFGKRSVKIKKIKDSNEIKSVRIKKIFLDHLPYGVRCMEFSESCRNEYVFYKIEKRATVLKKMIPMDAIYVLFISDSNFFAKHAKEIIWKMQKAEHAALKTDSRFFSVNNSDLKKLRTFPVNRLVFGSCEDKKSIGSIYTELAILLDE